MNDGKVYCEKGESDPKAALSFALAWGLACWLIIIVGLLLIFHS